MGKTLILKNTVPMKTNGKTLLLSKKQELTVPPKKNIRSFAVSKALKKLI
jgi:hypothetical protein